MAVESVAAAINLLGSLEESLGGGGVHLDMIVPRDAPDESIDELRTRVYDLAVRDFDGNFSAEHGIGPYNLA